VSRFQEPNLLQQKDVWAAKLHEMDRHVILVGYDDMEPLSGITLKVISRAKLRMEDRDNRY
jgi:hypothetical protein